MSSRAEREQRQQARLAAEAEERAAERRKDRLTTLAAIIGFVAIVGAAVIFTATRAGSHAAVVASAPGLTPAPSASGPVLPAHGPRPAGPLAAPLRANLAEANKVIDTPITQKLASLRGMPVVVNQWASWCTSCKAEFPFFQQESRRYLRSVAFVGLDAQDNRGDAESFLRRFPVDYPSVFDESAQQSASLGGGRGWPTTMFFDRSGRAFVHEGGYPSLASLEQDIQRYALGS